MKYGPVLLFLIFIGINTSVNAGDEDMNPTIYSRFDPETGFMIPNDPPPSSQQAHTATPGVIAESSQQDSFAPPQADETAQAYPLWVPVIAGFIGLVVIITLVKKRRPTADSRLD